MQAIRVTCRVVPGICRAVAAALALAGALAGAGAAYAAPVHVDPAFGYRIGDSIVAAGRIAIDERALLDQESLPKLGRVNGWLDLSAVNVKSGDGYRHVVRVFLVTASDVAPRLLFLPKAELKFRLDGREITEQLESVPISVSPLTGTAPILRTGFGELRPDRDVPMPETARAARHAMWLTALLVTLAALWAGLRLLALRRPGFAPFGRAAGRLRRLARRGARGSKGTSGISGSGGASGSDDLELERGRAAFRVMHEAFNETAGEAVFASQVDRFLSRHPRIAQESAAVHEFFRRSDAFFFGAAPGTRADPSWLAGLARRLARLEERGR